MAINFEAANMAGYNNPKIEVFRAIIDFGTNAISDAPRKTELIKCLQRGSIPAIMCASPDGSEGYLLWVYTWTTAAEGYAVTFGNTGLIITYSPDSDSPVIVTG